MLPSTPLHHLLMEALGFPVVATSGNASDEPICINETEALTRLQGIADLLFVHDRPIVRQVDDSVVRVVLDRELVLRRARGYAPWPVPLVWTATPPAPPPPMVPIIAMGGHLKNTVAVLVGAQAVLSQHLGDLGTAEGCALFRRVVNELPSLYKLRPAQAICDLHPDYRSTLEAEASGLPVLSVQHHHAHVAACMAEHQLRGAVLGVAWDGAGYGPDGTIWGGEFLLADETGFRRAATFRRFRLPGGERAMKEPWRAAVGLLYELWGPALFERDGLAPLQACPPSDRTALQSILARGVHAPETSSVGRLFDAVAAIIGLRDRVSFEGQAAMELEFAAEGERTDATYPFRFEERDFHAQPFSPSRRGRERDEGPSIDEGVMVIDWGPMIEAILLERLSDERVSLIAAKFHNTLAEMIVAVAGRIGQERVVLSGGCFQNRYLTERVVPRLQAAGFRPFWHQHIPPNDGGLSLGQLYIAASRVRRVDSRQ